MTFKNTPWPKVICLVDMNCFFAQVEQHDYPFWRNRPVAVTNGRLGSTIITSSYEARAYGVKTGMRLKEARERCPNLIQAPSRPDRYAEVSTRIMESLLTIALDVEVASCDEAYIDATACQSLYDGPEHIGLLIKQAISKASGLTCSVGISGDRTTAKFAAKLHKPDGLTIIPPWEAESRLAGEAVTELSGINKGIGGFLAQYGVYKCGDMKKIPISILAKRFGNPGRRIWLMAQGKDPEPVVTTVKDPKTIGHGKVLPPGTRDKAVVLTYMQHMAEKVGVRLRRHGFQSQHFFIGLRTPFGWIHTKAKLSNTTDDGAVIYKLCRELVDSHWNGQEVGHVQITANNPTSNRQVDLFEHTESKIRREALNQTIDKINERYGDFTVAPTRVIGRSEMPNVIAPSWKPSGHRKTI
ncbi:MAG: DNA polymerase IV [Methylophaga sp.]|jgi:DNA polymerase-4|nr:DNA polymerase IV [Methylophaga sp.]|tara:strand:- start:647 stop:1882 length:1236 start_codon:yes stop_codon:yes gene_type:complete